MEASNFSTFDSYKGMISHYLVVCCKPRHTDTRYLNFNSNHQKSNKESVILSLITWAENLITDANDLTIVKERIVNVLISNDYHKKRIKRVQNKIESQKAMKAKNKWDV